jgi:beta-glucosidase
MSRRARLLACKCLGLCVLLSLSLAGAAAERSPPVAPRKSAGAVEQRIEALLKKMTLEEKLGQLTQQWGGEVQDTNPGARTRKQEELLNLARTGKVGSFLGAHGAAYTNRLQRAAVEQSRLGIPLLLGNDVVHGYRTILPIPLAEAASWDPAIAELSAHVAAAEARAAGTHWTFAPMVDICRDPRWGRIAEGAGEDPYLGSVLAAARVRGFQGRDLAAADSVLACAKHLAAYGAAEGGRDYNTVDISERTLREVYLPPFHAAVRAGVGTVMSAFNEINGVPATANKLTLETILRREWGFQGFVVSDWTSISEMVVHGFAADKAQAAELALRAGVDMDMSSFTYRTYLGKAMRSGALPESLIDTAVRRVLRAKFALDLLDHPYADPQRERRVTLSKENRLAARRVAQHAIVLLKNDKGLLPLGGEVRRLAVIGPLADGRKDPLGTWAAIGKPEDVVTVLEGIKAGAPAGMKVSHARGCDLTGESRAGFAEAVRLAKQSDVALLVVGEGEDLSGEAHSRSTLDLPGVQRELVQAVYATGTPIVLVLMGGRPLTIAWEAEHVPAILETWHLGVEHGNAVAGLLFGDFNPSGKLPVTFPRSVGQIPIYYSHKNTGRPPSPDRYTSKYVDLPSTPLYPFGFGLSYTRFDFSNLQLKPARIGPRGRLTITVDVKNVGGRAGDEIVQLYVHDRVAGVTRPVKELKGFQRVTLRPGEAKTVSLTLTGEQLGYYNQQMQFVTEPGWFDVWVGPSSAEGLHGEFEVRAR